MLALNASALTSTSIIEMTGTSSRALYLTDEARRHGLNVYTVSERTLQQREFADFMLMVLADLGFRLESSQEACGQFEQAATERPKEGQNLLNSQDTERRNE